MKFKDYLKRGRYIGDKNKLSSNIEKMKQKIIKKPITKGQGIYRKIGKKEVKKLENKYIDSSDYSPEMEEMRSMIENFSKWCIDYAYKSIKHIRV